MRRVNVIFLMLCCFLCSVPAWSQHIVKGIVKDAKAQPIIGANVIVRSVQDTLNYKGGITDENGQFIIKEIEEGKYNIDILFIGYADYRQELTLNQSIDLGEIILAEDAMQLDEVVIYGGDARRIVEEALKKNPSAENMMSAFYWETVQKGQRYIGISEAMMDVYKTSYVWRTTERDMVQLSKARRLLSQKQSDTLAVKVVGGPNLSLYLDVVKNADALFEQQTLEYYTFTQEPSALLDDRVQYVISFRPRVRLGYALFKGKVFIDREKLAFTRAEFSLDLSDREKAIAAVLHKKPAGLRFPSAGGELPHYLSPTG